MNYNLIFITVFLNLFIIIFYKKIIKFFNTYDQYDGIRKFQKKPVPIIGGLIISSICFCNPKSIAGTSNPASNQEST